MIQLANDPNASRTSNRPEQSEAKGSNPGAQRGRSGHAWPFLSRYASAARPAGQPETRRKRQRKLMPAPLHGVNFMSTEPKTPNKLADTPRDKPMCERTEHANLERPGAQAHPRAPVAGTATPTRSSLGACAEP